MLARAWGAVLDGVEAVPVRVEVDVASGLPAFSIVGLPDPTVQEARDRVRAAIAHSGESYPMKRITANLAPSDVRKQGAGLDLALAVAILAASGSLPPRGLDGRLFSGELGLAGDVRAVRGVLQAAEAARAAGLAEVVCARANAREAALAGLPATGVLTLAETVELVRGGTTVPFVREDPTALLDGGPPPPVDFAQIRRQDHAKRAFEIAAAGGHNVLVSGPPGSGKTLLARALGGILPRLGLEEALEVTRIHSAAGLLRPGEPLVRSRPFRAPHHGTSVAAMVGGGSAWARPGEVTLAHRGILFLDELPEFPRSVLESLRQPLEDGFVTVTRSRRTSVFPARFALVAAMNPCPCGYAGSERPCSCTPRLRAAYASRLSGPLLDRVDLQVRVGRVESTELLAEGAGTASALVQRRVERAREMARARLAPLGLSANAEIPPGRLLAVTRLSPKARRTLAVAADRHRLSARAVHRIVRTSRTIADLSERDDVGREEILEALTYRVDREGEPDA